MTAPALQTVIGVYGIAELTGHSPVVVHAWKKATLAGAAQPYGRDPLPLPCLKHGRVYLWFTEDIVDWAVREGLAQMPAVIPAAQPVLALSGIAKWAQVTYATAVIWRDNARRFARGKLPEHMWRVRLPQPDMLVDGVELWLETTIERWWKARRQT